MIDRRRTLGLAVGAVLALTGLSLTYGHAIAEVPAIYIGPVKGVAVSGYDPVAYFTEKKPVKGNPALSLDYKGAKWYFASEANRVAFKAAPETYAPQYGGYCAWAAALGKAAKGDPEAWTIHKGKLYLNYNKEVSDRWKEKVDENIAKADVNWPSVLAE